ncbi:DUF4139 domain-containing protein [Paracoccus aminophilus]|uniref:Mucoidy inhibitor MuiA family protein n=1 Tax=Paracoccus aminophilus JCM 7686 TaxID=1367847 RepID=S5Y3Z3_PARAH|nr:DUF4139 domain-containing protein [Paracoccus aminophilus]AGT10455.1 hypothetical protein JCM7686_3420 [Paracoccus aminophilus JCM 7686]
MHRFLLTTALSLAAAPVFADQIETKAPISHVTIYPSGASVTRNVAISAAAGSHELVITGLPTELDPASLRIDAQGATVGAVSLQEDRALPASREKSQEVLDAEAEVRRLETALDERDAKVAEIRAKAQAAQDVITFLLKMAESKDLAATDLNALTDTVGNQILKARQLVITAETEARQADQGRSDDVDALQDARARLEALRSPESDHKTLVITVETGAAPAQLEITGFTSYANWSPVYDLRLDRAAKKLTLDRGFLVSQNTGEDWSNAKLTFSTARPSDQSAPSELYPWMPRIEKEPPPAPAPVAPASPMADADEAAMSNRVAAVAEVEHMAGGAEIRQLGATVVYDYPTPVTIRDGVDALRLTLDSRELTPDIRAEAVPSRDSSAYLVAETKNTLDEVILPGEATLYADGPMVGRSQLELTPAGKELTLGFGPIDGLVAEFRVPEEAEGGQGIFTKSNAAKRTTVLEVKNLTGEDWPLRVIGQVPVSTQNDLKITWSASQKPTTEGRDGKRGLLEWDSTLAAKAVQDITLTTEMSWPDGMTLYGGSN